MKQYVIIGNSAAGTAAIEAIRQTDQQSKILVISDEAYPAYCRCLISYYLAGGVKKEKIFYRSEDFYKQNKIELLLNKKVVRVEPRNNRIVLEDKSQVGFDYLLIATGAAPKIPQDIKGIKKTGVFGFRTLKDIQDISAVLPVAKTACVLGGGLVGLKAAYALKKRNIEVKVIIKSKQVLSQMLDAQAAGFIQQRLEENGIDLVFGEDIIEIIGEGDIKAVKLASGKVFGCSLVVVAKGVEPNIGLVKNTQIRVNQGIDANSLLQTNVPNIYTAGDVCESFDLALNTQAINALWPVAVEQGRIAGINMAGGNINYEGSLGMNSIEFFDLPVISLGIYRINKEDASLEELKYCDSKANIYKKLILKNNILVGAVLAGDIKQSGIYLRLIKEKADLSSFKTNLLDENFSYPRILDLLKEKETRYV